MRFPGKSIRGRMLLAAIVIEATMLTLLVANSLRLLSQEMTEQASSHAAQMTPVLQAALIAPLAQRDFSTVKAILDECSATQGIDYLAVMDSGGKLVAVSGWDMAKPLPPADERFRLFTIGEAPRFNVASPILVSGQKLGTVHFGLDLSRILAAHRLLLGQGALIALGELMLSAGLLALVGFWLTRHLTALTHASEAVAMGNLTPPRVWEGQDDVGRLGVAFNAMSKAVHDRIQDLTEARDVQATLAQDIAETHRRLDEITNTMGDGLYVIDTLGEITFVNPRAEDLLGWTREELIGRQAHELFHRHRLDGSPFPTQACEAQAVLMTGEPYRSGDEAYLRKDGTYIRVSLVVTPILREDRIEGAVVSFQDVSESLHNAQALKLSEERFAFAIEGSGDGLWDWNIPAHTVFYSKTWKQMIGYLPQELGTGLREWESRVHPDDLAPTLAALQDHMDGRTSVYLSEHRFQKRDGSYIWVLDRGRVVEWDDKGHPIRMIGTHADITLRKDMERSLQQRDLILDAVSRSVVSLLDSENWKEGIPQFLESLGKAASASRVYIFRREPAIPGEDEVLMSQVFTWCADGLHSLTANADPGDIPMKAVGYGRWLQELQADRMICGQLSEFPAPEQALLTRRSVRSILVMPVHVRGEWWGLIGFDECQGSRTWSSPEQEVLRLAGRALGSKIERAETRLELERLVLERTRELDQKNLDLVTEMETRQSIEASSRAVMVELEQARKMESIGRLAAGIAHEINTPTQFLGNNLGFLKDGYRRIAGLLDAYQRATEALPSTQKETLQDLAKHIKLEFLKEEIPQAIDESMEGIDRITKIVNAMKEFSHPGGKEKGPVDVNHCLMTTSTVTRNQWKYVADLQWDLDPNLPCIHGLPAELGQVFLNLLVNAADAIGERSPLLETRGLIRVTTRSLPEAVEIRIDDNGKGMTEEVLKRIYDPFFTTKGVGKGTGQGLTVCYQVVVNLHGGSIQCESTPEVGTSFVLHLPLDEPSGHMEATRRTSHARASSR